jgi:type IV pilus assembly protein PilO
MTLDDLRKLNPKDIANWPLGPKAAALGAGFALILFAGYWFDWQDQLAQLDTAKQKEVQLRETFLAKKKQAINLEVYRQQLKDLEQAFGALLKQLPNKSEMESLLTDINQAGLGRGLEFDLFRPGQETMSEFYAELPITIRVTGNYHDLGAFASDVSQLPRIVTLNDINIAAAPSGRLTMNAIAKTYRYLDESEIAAQKRAAKGKEVKK